MQLGTGAHYHIERICAEDAVLLLQGASEGDHRGVIALGAMGKEIVAQARCSLVSLALYYNVAGRKPCGGRSVSK